MVIRWLPASPGFKPVSLSPKGPRKSLLADSDKSNPYLIMMTRQMQCSSWPGLNHTLTSDMKEEISLFCRSEVWNGFHWAKISVRRAVFPLEAPQENLLPCLFQLMEVACILWITAPSFILKVSSTASSNLSLTWTSPSASLCHFKGPLWLHWAHPENPG